MKLRSLAVAALAASLMLGSTFGATAEEVLRLRMNGDINSVDPIATTNFTIRNSAYLIYDTLFALDADFVVQPQMAEGHTLSDDQLTYTITLRDGLMFHDGTPVTAADAVASLQRWGVPGSVAVYEKFADYVPRTEPASMAAGGKVAKFDRIEIRYIPDASQAVDALLNDEIDWIEDVAADLIPLFEGSDTAHIFANPQGGNSLQLVVNHPNPPFDNPKAREALQWALEPTPFMQAIFGEQTQLY
jgi:ABC-type transport system substrate-binding protein